MGGKKKPSFRRSRLLSLLSTTKRESKQPRPPAEREGRIPHHVAIIMDGNGRWAQERGLPRQAGYRAGTENLRRLIRAFAEREVQFLTLFAFSTENWRRPKREINPLLRLIGRVLDRELSALHENGVRLVHIGNLEPLSDDLRRRICNAVDLTKNNTRLTVCVAFNYGSRAEIVEAVRRAVREGLNPDEITEESFDRLLGTAGMPEPDLVIRTAGEMRMSNFLLWQAAYAEFYSTPVYWPDFDEAEIDRALAAYGQRVRRFGGLEGPRANGLFLNGKHPRG
jgi:undecaprenyl diphosphate synthase